MATTPEQKARRKIDRLLEQCGWVLQDYDEMNIMAAVGVAIREFPLSGTGHADYMLYADGQAIGIVEAKPEGYTLTGVETQSAKYVTGFPEHLPRWSLPLPFAYESTGTVTQFTSALDPDARSREVFAFHRPQELIRLAKLGTEQLRFHLRQMPPLDTTKLWAKQVTAITNLEKSLAENRPRSLIQMATGSGKTFTSCNISYRLIKFAKAKRILFLVDRNNLGKQTLTEFQQFASPYNAYKFTEEFGVQHLRKNTIDPACKVCITTIQRLYSILKGEEDFDEANEEGSLFESAPSESLVKEPLPVVYNAKIPPEFFDFIIIDECHRSIYNIWRQVLEYFDSFLIGLTATPSAQTIGFFGSNLVMEYTHAQAVVDGVNVGYDVYRIDTEITKNGATLARQPGYLVPHRDRTTRRKRYASLDNDVLYQASQLDRDVVNDSQMRLVIRTFRDKLHEMFPGRTEVPKTLVFAKTDLHADDLTKIIREEFAKGNDFCQKITSKTTGKKPDELLNEFRNSYNPRIAVTVDMIATGTDVKPLECLVFMRNINSASYFEQMKGRGCRIVNPDVLQSVTPDARLKTHFVIVDAVGVTESEKTLSKPLDKKPGVPLKVVLTTVAAGAVSDEIVSTLAAKLTRLDRELDDDQRQQIAAHANGTTPAQLAQNLLASIDPDAVTQKAVTKFNLAPDVEPTDEQYAAVEKEAMTAALQPFHNPRLRKTIELVKGIAEQVMDEVNQDTLRSAGFSAAAREKARSIITSFKQFIEENKDEIEAIKLLYSQPHRRGLRYRQVKELAQKLAINPFFVDPKKPESVLRIWNAFGTVEPDKVKGHSKHLVDLISLVRHAIGKETLLVPVEAVVEERYQHWLTEKQAAGTVFTPEQRKWLDAVKNHIAASLAIEQDDLEEIPFKQFGGLGAAFQLFGNTLPSLLSELNERLTA
jgi:type I restriction enzyme R subunit